MRAVLFAFLAAPALAGTYTAGPSAGVVTLDVAGQSLAPAQVNTAGPGQSTFTPNLSSSTTGGSLSGTFTNTSLGPCIANSTITLNLPSGNSLIAGGFSGSMSDGNLAANISVGILLDGALVNGETTSKGLVSVQQAVSGDTENFSFPFFLSGLATGSHTVCLTALVSAGTGTIDSTNSNARFWMYMLP